MMCFVKFCRNRWVIKHCFKLKITLKLRKIFSLKIARSISFCDNLRNGMTCLKEGGLIMLCVSQNFNVVNYVVFQKIAKKALLDENNK